LLIELGAPDERMPKEKQFLFFENGSLLEIALFLRTVLFLAMYLFLLKREKAVWSLLGCLTTP